jgi:hypothetical protein
MRSKSRAKRLIQSLNLFVGDFINTIDPSETLAAKIAVVHNAAIFSAMW